MIGLYSIKIFALFSSLNPGFSNSLGGNSTILLSIIERLNVFYAYTCDVLPERLPLVAMLLSDYFSIRSRIYFISFLYSSLSACYACSCSIISVARIYYSVFPTYSITISFIPAGLSFLIIDYYTALQQNVPVSASFSSTTS